MKYYICYSKEDQKQANRIKDLLCYENVGFVDLSQDFYESDILEKIMNEIDSSDILIALHSYSFKNSLLCNIQLVYASKKVEKLWCIPIDSAVPDRAFATEFKRSNFTHTKSFSGSVKQILDAEKQRG